MDTLPPDRTTRRGLRLAAWTAGAALLGFATVRAFLAYLDPDRVMDFAAFLQMCGIALPR